jgi:hypothetical protein
MSVNISGAVDIRILYYQHRKFILFSDIHTGFKGLCPQKCLTNNDDVDYIDKNDICYDIDGAIKKIIIEANKKGEYVDVFFESHFYTDPPHKTLVLNPIDPLDATIRAYRTCLYDKHMCPYKNARFHYIDIRQGMTQNTKFLGLLPNLMNTVTFVNKLPIFNKIPAHNDVLGDYLPLFTYNHILRLFLGESNITNSNLWRFIDILVESNNYIVDINNFLDRILIIDTSMVDIIVKSLSNRFKQSSVPFISSSLLKLFHFIYNKIRFWATDSTMIVSRDSKILSRIKAQLDGLYEQGDNIMGDMLKQYIYNKIKSLPLTSLTNIVNLQFKYILNYLDSGTYEKELLRKLPENPLLHLSSYIMDMYTISRMFRIFPNSGHVVSSYVVVHQGKGHINIMTEFLQLMGASIDIYNPIQNYERCVNIPNNFFLTI